MKSMEDFQRHYETDLKPVLSELELWRKRICKKFFRISAGIIVGGGGILFALYSINAPSWLLFILGALAVIGIFGTYAFLTSSFVDEFKRRIIADIVKFYDPSLTYAPDHGIAQSRFAASRLFKHRIDRYSKEDYVSGKIQATTIEFSEVHAEYKTEHRDSKGRRRTEWHTIFKGIFFIGDFNKNFNGITIVLPDKAERLFGFLGKKFQSVFKHYGELIKLEDPEFEKFFVVYGDDQIEARYILSTSLMKRIVDFKKKTGHKIYLSFVNSNVTVAISTRKDMFEPKVFSTLMDFNLAREYLEDLQLAAGIVEDLNLNTRIWTKR